MKTKLLFLLLILSFSNIYSQKTEKPIKWRSTEIDTFTVAQTMFDDQNFVMVFPFLFQFQKNHPTDVRLKYMLGICCLFREEKQQQGLELLLDVYKNNKNAEDIEYYVALAYHYNHKFTEALDIIDVYLSKKKLSKPQIRGGEKLKEYCKEGKTITPSTDEGKLDDYIKLVADE
jgi:hypothetical protein